MKLIVGLDVGGTGTKVVVCDETGAMVGRGTGGGGNMRSAEGDPAGNIAGALVAALAGHDPAEVVAGMMGMAGSAARPRRAREIADTAWHSAGLAGSPEIGTDLDIAYAAGDVGGDGVLLLAGTGAVSAEYRDHRMVRRCDGLGWLVGDEGSAVWLGMAALRAAAAALDGRGPATVLAERVHDRMMPAESTGDPRQDLVAGADDWRPARLGELAPLVVEAASAGDEVADRILSDGCAALVRAALAVAGDATRLVLAGSMLTTPGPVADRVTASLADRFPAPATAPYPVVGAVLDAFRAARLPTPAGLAARLRERW